MDKMQDCNWLREELGRTAKMNQDLFDPLFEYRKWWDLQGITSETEDGWPKQFCFESKNIIAFAEYWHGRLVMKEHEQPSSQFRKAMLAAFRHGRVFKLSQALETNEQDPKTMEDKHLPFAEWFAKHYQE